MTDEERSEVARRLRRLNAPSLIALMSILGVGGRDMCARLADLIEPSCDREALLALAEELANVRRWSCYTDSDLLDIADRIREACGVVA